MVGTHPEAVRKFLGTELAGGGMTSVWSSGKLAFNRCEMEGGEIIACQLIEARRDTRFD